MSSSPAEPSKPSPEAETPKCGVVMPISGYPDVLEYTAGHWLDVKSVIFESIEAAGFSPNLVSDGEGSGLIQGRIVRNLGSYPMVVCDVSGKNPNVMFELGLRLAFDLPTIVIKDELTTYSFDTSPIEHLPYLSGLNIYRTKEFQQRLTEKILATRRDHQNGKGDGTFLSHFSLQSVKLGTKEVSNTDLLLEKITNSLAVMNQSIAALERRNTALEISPAVNRGFGTVPNVLFSSAPRGLAAFDLPEVNKLMELSEKVEQLLRQNPKKKED
jgi:hypothetical protein